MTMNFTMAGRVTDCVQLTYRTPADSVRSLVPDGLELVQRGPWAFWSVMGCRVHKLRPANVPAFCGVTYHHVAYRLMVQAMTDRAEVIRGLYDTQSDVSARAVAAVGSRLALRMHAGAITLEADDTGVSIQVCQDRDGTGALALDARHAPARLLPGSCFPTVADARAFCQCMPNVLSVVESQGVRALRVTRAQRQPGAWSQTPLAIHAAKLGYFESIGQAEHIQLEWACRQGPADVHWRVGEVLGLLGQPAPKAAIQRAVG